MIRITHRGSFKNIERFLELSNSRRFNDFLDTCGVEGVSALTNVTPRDSGLTSESWGYEKVFTRYGLKVIWTNTNIVAGIPVAILIQYGHGTRSGSFVEGVDFINPAMRPIFDRLADRIWKEVTSR